jgi:biotin-[acetyl-CoA-carboxylase] ligase BirA-like protein
MDAATLVGGVATLVSAISFLPQAWKVIHTRDTRSISVGMYAVTVLGFALWLGYGLVLGRWPLLPIAVGVSLAERLNCLPERAGAVRLKWPNDLWIGERKIGGILIETRRDRGGIARAVIGVGLNLLDGAHLQAFETPATALFGETFTGSRAALGAEIVAAILAAYAQLQAGDDRSLFARWLVLDALQGRTVRIEQQDGHALQGLADGIEPDGSLRVLVGDQVRKVVSAEGSVRIVAQDETALESPSVGPAQPLE